MRDFESCAQYYYSASKRWKNIGDTEKSVNALYWSAQNYMLSSKYDIAEGYAREAMEASKSQSTEEQKKQIEVTAQGILDAREKYPDCSLADLYDETTMPPELRKAHQANDKAVMKLYGYKPDMPEPTIVADLMKRYQELIARMGSSKKS